MHSPTLLLVLMALVTMMSCTTFVLWRLYPSIRGIREWFFGFAFALLNVLNFLTKPDLKPLIDVLLTQFLLVMTGIMACLGVYRFLGVSRFPFKAAAATLATVLLAAVYFLNVEPNPAARFMIGSIAAGLFLILAGVAMLRGAHELPARILFAFSLLFHGAFMFVRPFLVDLPAKHLLFADLSFGASQLILSEQILVTVLLGLGVIMLVNEEVSQALKIRADRDALTNLYNRGAFIRQLGKAISLTFRTSAPLSLMVIDVDRFKTINDRFGHMAGDQALAEFAQLVGGIVRHEDTAGRLGGEEFSIFLPNTALAAAVQIAERLRIHVERAEIEYGNKRIEVQISIGVATLVKSDTAESLIARADQAMYAAKSLGRNRVEFKDLIPT